MLLGNASRGRIVARSIIEIPGGFAKIFALARHAPLAGKALRFPGPAAWAAFGPEAVDVIFVDGRSRVIHVAARLRRWRAVGPIDGAREYFVLEAGACERIPIREGDLMERTPHTSERIAAGAKPPEHF